MYTKEPSTPQDLKFRKRKLKSKSKTDYQLLKKAKKKEARRLTLLAMKEQEELGQPKIVRPRN